MTSSPPETTTEQRSLSQRVIRLTSYFGQQRHIWGVALLASLVAAATAIRGTLSSPADVASVSTGSTTESSTTESSTTEGSTTEGVTA